MLTMLFNGGNGGEGVWWEVSSDAPGPCILLTGNVADVGGECNRMYIVIVGFRGSYHGESTHFGFLRKIEKCQYLENRKR